MNELKTYKTIKIETLEKRFEKLHSAANYAEECAKAIVFHAGRFTPLPQSFQKMSDAVNDWCDKLAKLGSAMQKVESQYYENLVNNNKDCVLIEAVPNFKKHGFITPNSYQVDAELFQIGFYELEGDPYAVSKHIFSNEEIVDGIQSLRYNMDSFVRALAGAEYKGIWQDVGEIVNDIFDTIPDTAISDLLQVQEEILPLLARQDTLK